MRVLRGILRNTFFLTLGNLGGKLLGMLLMAMLARAVGPAGIGAYSYAMSVTSILMLLPDFGFDRLLVRELARDRQTASDFVGRVFLIKMFLNAAATLLLFLFLLWKRYDPLTTHVLLISMASSVMGSFLLTTAASFRAFERMDVEARLTILNSALRLACGAAAIWAGMSIVGILAALLIPDAVLLGVSLVIMNRRFFSVRMKPELRPALSLWRIVIPFGIMSLIEVVFYNTDTLVIARLQGETAVGWYSAANRIMSLLFIVPGMFMAAIYPVFSRLSASVPDAMRQAYTKSFTYLLIISFPIAAGGTLVADPLIPLIYGEAFRNSVRVFQAMTWLAVCNFVGYVNGTTLIALGRERMFAATWSAFVVANAVLDYIFVLWFGYIGAVYVSLVLGAMMLVLYSVWCHRLLHARPEWSVLLRALAACAGMSAAVLAVKQWSGNLAALIPVGGVVFLALGAALRLIPAGDLRSLREALAARGRRDEGEEREGR